MMSRLALAVVILTAACGGDVTVGDGSAGEGQGASGGLAEGGGQPDPGCALCGHQDCGLCAQSSSATYLFACRGSGPPLGYKSCYQTGSIFQDEIGPYVCWSCE